jgi:hypothetical protein
MASAVSNVASFSPAAQMQVRRYPLRDGDPGIARTITWMNAIVRGKEGFSDPRVRATAVDIVRGLSNRDRQGQIAAVLTWVKQNIDFRGEYKELLQTPVVTLQLCAGDCDDHSMLISSLLKTLGFTTRFSTVAADAEDPSQFTHVFCEVLDPTTEQWIALDSTVKSSTPGWRPKNLYREKAWPAMGDANMENNIFGLLQPLSQAAAYNIAGVQPSVTDVNFGNLFSSTSQNTILGLPWWLALLLLGGVVWLMDKK